MSNLRLDQLFGELGARVAEAAEIECNLGDAQTRVARDQRALKGRKKLLWLASDGTGPNPAIDGKNAEIREAQHATIAAADHEVLRLRQSLDTDDALVIGYRASLNAAKRSIAAIETKLATLRADLNARAAEAFGRLATTGNGRPEMLKAVAGEATAAVREG